MAKTFVDCEFDGYIDKTIRYIEENQLLNSGLWQRFVQQFRENADDHDCGWRGEYWGKMMRGASFTYSYTKNQALYKALTKTIEEMLASEDEQGRISTYSSNSEFRGWDLWCRKYVLLGMQYYIEICDDKNLISKITKSMCRQADYIIERIGKEKLSITEATNHWRGLNSASILEPIMKLFNLTKQQKYFDFATYIVNTGATSVCNIFELAAKDEFYPYQYPVTKAYEMISCFEGLLEYYLVDKNEAHKTAIVNFANKILERDFTVIGCSGCTHELFDYSTARQANTTNGEIMQETCVSVTLMKFFYRLTALQKNSAYADAFERTLYNAYFGSINTNKNIDKQIKNLAESAIVEPMVFDSYSPLTCGTRGNGIGGLKLMSDNHYFGCCACIGSAGAGLISKMAVMSSADEITINLYIQGLIQTNNANLKIETQYPKDGAVKIYVTPKTSSFFKINLRCPEWSEQTNLFVNKKRIEAKKGYISINRQWQEGDLIEINLDMRTKAILPTPYGSEILMNKVIWGQNYMVSTYDIEDPKAKNHLALQRGPLMLAADDSLGYDASKQFSILVNKDGYVSTFFSDENIASYENIIELCVPMTNGGAFRVVDYASAGKDWSSKIAVWLHTNKE